MSFVALGLGLLLLILPLALAVIRNDPKELGLAPYGATSQTAATFSAQLLPAERTSILQAIRTLPFWLLAGSFCVCGYTTSGLVLTHLIPHASELGFHATQAAQALGIMGVFNVVGTLASGWICDRFGDKVPLAGYYILRGCTLIFLPYLDTVVGLF